MGDSPFSPIGGGVTFGEYEASVLHRHYVVWGLNASSTRLQAAVGALASIRTTKEAYSILQLGSDGGKRSGGGGSSFDESETDDRPPWMRLKASIAKTKQLQMKILGLAARRDFDGACKLLSSLHKAADAAVRHAEEVKRRLAPASCGSGSSSATGGGAAGDVLYWLGRGLLMIPIVGAIGVLALMLKGRMSATTLGHRKPPKVNLD